LRLASSSKILSAINDSTGILRYLNLAPSRYITAGQVVSCADLNTQVSPAS
jgi:hypothetical protein